MLCCDDPGEIRTFHYVATKCTSVYIGRYKLCRQKPKQIFRPISVKEATRFVDTQSESNDAKQE